MRGSQSAHFVHGCWGWVFNPRRVGDGPGGGTAGAPHYHLPMHFVRDVNVFEELTQQALRPAETLSVAEFSSPDVVE